MHKNNSKSNIHQDLISSIYYGVKPIIPRYVQIQIRRSFLLRKLPKVEETWPIDQRAGLKPPQWAGWPEGKKFAFLLTHDVETLKGHERCRKLAALEKSLGFKSSFNFLLKRYNTSSDLRRYLTENGFEIGIHGLYHDGKKFKSREIFMERAKVINRYLKKWDAVGFRAPSMHCNLEWIRELDIKYDLSTFDTDPFEPKSTGVQTIFPFRVGDTDERKGYVELPYTLPQDFTLFVLLGEKSPEIWKRKLDWIVEHGGMALVNVHPDYLTFNGEKPCFDEYPVSIFKDFLLYVKEKYEGQYWHCLPKNLAQYFQESSPLSLDTRNKV